MQETNSRKPCDSRTDSGFASDATGRDRYPHIPSTLEPIPDNSDWDIGRKEGNQRLNTVKETSNKSGCQSLNHEEANNNCPDFNRDDSSDSGVCNEDDPMLKKSIKGEILQESYRVSALTFARFEW